MSDNEVMKSELIVKNSVKINAPVSRVWEALTDPKYTREYMYGCDVISDWKPGSPVLWQGSYEGKQMVFVKGNVVKIEPGKRLQYTLFDPNMGIEDIPENYLTVTYDLIEEDGTTELKVTRGDCSKVAEGEKRYQDTLNSWEQVLKKIKELLEQ